MPIQDRGRNAPIVDPEPGAAGEEVEAGDDLGAVRPVPTRRLRRAVDHLVAVGADDDRPFVLGPAQDNKGAHAAVSGAPKGGLSGRLSAYDIMRHADRAIDTGPEQHDYLRRTRKGFRGALQARPGI